MTLLKTLTKFIKRETAVSKNILTKDSAIF